MGNTETQKTKTISFVHKGYKCYQIHTGEFGMIKQDLADACGISVSAVNRYIRQTMSNASKHEYASCVKKFEGKNVKIGRVCVSGKARECVSILKWDFCWAIIDYIQQKKQQKEERILVQSRQIEPAIIPLIHEGYSCYKTYTGEIGMTKQDLADACGVTLSAINYFISQVRRKTYWRSVCSEWLMPFINTDIILIKTSEASKNKQYPAMLLKWKFCLAVIQYYQAQKANDESNIKEVHKGAHG